jgi:hypothetical protein
MGELTQATDQVDFKQPQSDINPEQPSGRPMTFGERLVGLNFNPSNDDNVSKAKRLCAELADLVQDHVVHSNRETTQMEQQLHSHVIGEILNAQMNVVKILTLKY